MSPEEAKALLAQLAPVLVIGMDADGAATCFVAHAALPPMPEQAGVLLADVMRHFAVAYAQRDGLDAKAATIRVWAGFLAESKRPSSGLEVLS